MKNFLLKIKKAIGENKAIAAVVIACFATALLALHVHILCLIFPKVSDFVNIYISGAVRFVLAKISGVLPFSLGETVVCVLPLFIVLMFVFVIASLKREKYGRIKRFFALAFAVVSLFYTSFVFTLGMGYHGTTLDKKIGLECKDLTSDELLEVAKWLANKVNAYAPQVQFIDEGSSVMPYDFKGMNDALNKAYAGTADKYGFVMGFSSRIKPVMNSRFMTKAGLLGVYSYYTGESNVNVDYMDYNLVFTCAHEMSHQRGIAKENEANFMAFLVCTKSDDPYLNYSGYLNMLDYIRGPLYTALEKDKNTGAYRSLMNSLDARARRDIGLSDKKTAENQGTVSNISNRINDTFIKSNGDKHGTDSYGLVIELLAAYYFDQKTGADA